MPNPSLYSSPTPAKYIFLEEIFSLLVTDILHINILKDKPICISNNLDQMCEKEKNGLVGSLQQGISYYHSKLFKTKKMFYILGSQKEACCQYEILFIVFSV